MITKEAKLSIRLIHTDWHTRGCLTGRGVLIDFKSYAEDNNISYSPFSGFRINVTDIETVAKSQGVTFKPGDILIIRWGYTEALGEMNAEEQRQSMHHHRACGVDGSTEMAKWLWNRHFAAVASDTLAFEAMPPVVDGEETEPFELGEPPLLPLLLLIYVVTFCLADNLVLHQWCLSLLGLPIGELWDLKALAEHCKMTGRYTFFLTSAPLNVPGAVGSPPNALAIL